MNVTQDQEIIEELLKKVFARYGYSLPFRVSIDVYAVPMDIPTKVAAGDHPSGPSGVLDHEN
jgi:hypothetical protein